MELRHMSPPPPAALKPPMVGVALGAGRTGLAATDAPTDGGTA